MEQTNQVELAGSLIQKAREMKPILAELAAACEANRRVPDETVQMFAEAGFYKILQPVEFGGYELPPQVLCEVVMEIASACPSSGWCLGIVSVHSWELGLMDREVQTEIWGDDQSVLLSSSYAPFGTLTPTDGGYRLSGRWSWSSGSSHCTWAILGAMCPDYGTPGQVAAVIPISEYEIVDVWHAAGLGGTGSNDIVVNDVFVPYHRIHSQQGEHYRETMPEGSAPCYYAPFFTVFGYCLASATLGMAKGALEEYIRRNGTRKDAFAGSATKENPFVQQRLAEAQALIDACELKMRRDFSEVWARCEKLELSPLDRRAAYRWNQNWIARSAKSAVDRIMEASGGGAWMKSQSLQRFMRDVAIASNHAFLNYDNGSAGFGQYLLSGTQQNFTF